MVGGNAPTLQPQEHFSCSQDFRCSLYGLLIFTFCSRSLMLCKCERAENKQLSKVSRMPCKVHCFCFQRAGLSFLAISLLHRPSSSLLIGWYAMRCTFEAMGNPEEFFKEATGHTQWQMIWDANVGPRKRIHLEYSCQNFHTKHTVKLNAVVLHNRLHLALSLCFSAREQSCCSCSSV